jgi:twitching motility protein PilT
VGRAGAGRTRRRAGLLLRGLGSELMHVNDLLQIAVENGASDLHLKVGSYPMMRIHGLLQPASEEKRLTHEDTVAMAAAVMSTAQRQKFKELQEVDLAYSVPGLGRFRCNVFQQRGTIGVVLRVIPIQIKTIDELDLPPVLKKIADEDRGLVLVTGTTGSGKSTTLAGMIDHVNATRCVHIITVEDPIEFLQRDNRSIINQREVEVDTSSFAHALRSALRQDPDVILVGEMRDFETIETALVAAETGHLVFSTLHTLDATETINRIIAVFPPHQQKQVRLQLAAVLKAVISQRLIPRADGAGRVPAVEVMINTPFIRDCVIDKEKTHLIPGAIAAGVSQYGMQTFDQSIFGLYQRRLVTYEEALHWASNVDEFKLKVQGISMTADSARDEMASSVLGGRPGAQSEVTRFGKS